MVARMPIAGGARFRRTAPASARPLLGLVALALVLFVPSGALATDFFVDAVGGSDVTGNGTRGNPWQTVTHALTLVMGPGDTIRVAPGTYDSALGESFPLNMRPGVSVVSQAGFRSTVLRAPGSPAGGDGSDGPFRPVVDTMIDTDVQSVFNFTDIIIPDGVRVLVRGSQPLVMRVVGDVEIAGVLELSGTDGQDGVAGDASAVVLGGIPGAGGAAGGNANDPPGAAAATGQNGGEPMGTGGGGRGGQRSNTVAGGGGGGGHSTPGQMDFAETSGVGGAMYGDNTLTTLFGGSGGGGGGNGANADAAQDDTGGAGGGGGGGVFIDARGVVRISGRVKAEGGVGGSGAGTAGGGGGASGGSIRISGTDVLLLPESRILAGGGARGEAGGGGGRAGGAGADGRIRFEDRDGVVDTSMAFIRPMAVEAFLVGSTAPDVVVYPSGQSFDSEDRFVGFTVAGGNRGILVDAGDGSSDHRPRIRGNAVVECDTGIQCQASNGGIAAPFISSNYVYDNRTGMHVAGTDGTVQPYVTNNTVTINGAGYSIDSAFTGTQFSSLANCLVWQNGIDLVGLSSAEVVRCNLTSGEFVGLNGNTSLGPRFVDKQARDLRIDPATSPLVDRGLETAVGLDGFDPDGEPRHYDFDGDGGREPDLGADEAGLVRFMKRYGEMNGRVGPVTDNLFINGQVGDSSRRQLNIDRGAPFRLTLSAPIAGPSVVPYVLYVFLGPPDNTTLSPLPLELGTMVFGIPLSGQTDGVRTLVNNVIHPQSKAALGCGLLQAPDAPAVIHFDRGVRAPVTVTFQAIMVDLGAENGIATVSNASVVTFQ